MDDQLSASSQATWQTADVESLVAGVLLDACSQEVDLVAVIESGDGCDGWNVFVRTDKRRLKTFHLAPGSRAAMRSAIKLAVER